MKVWQVYRVLSAAMAMAVSINQVECKYGCISYPQRDIIHHLRMMSVSSGCFKKAVHERGHFIQFVFARAFSVSTSLLVFCYNADDSIDRLSSRYCQNEVDKTSECCCQGMLLPKQTRR